MASSLSFLWLHDHPDPSLASPFFLSSARYTCSKFKSGKSESDLQAELLTHLTPYPFPYLMTRESTKKSTHVHIIYYTTDPDFFRDIFREYLQNGKSAYMSKSYDVYQDDKIPEYFFGYILKEFNVLHTNITHDKQQECYNTYKRMTSKTTDDMVNYVIENYPSSNYCMETLLNTILDYHKHSRKVFDYKTIIKREFHLCRLIMFETIERDYLTKHHTKLLDL